MYYDMISELQTVDEVIFSTIDEDACEKYQEYLDSVPTSSKPLYVRIQTRADYILVVSPGFRYVSEALKWYKQIDFIDMELFAYLGYYDEEEDEFIQLAELEVEK